MIDKILKKFLKNDPDKKCITDSKKTYTFKEINEKIEYFSSEFKKYKKKNLGVGILLNRDVNYLSVILTCLKLKIYYVPFSRKSSKININRQIKESKVDLLITYKNNKISFLKKKNLKSSRFNELAYIIFTSGSTGEKKAVPITYTNYSCYFKNIKNNFQKSFKSKSLIINGEISFDIVNADLVFALLFNCEIYITSDSNNLYELYHMIKKYKIESIYCVPSTWEKIIKIWTLMDGKKINFIKQINSGGEVLTYNLFKDLEKFSPNSKKYNFYGPTEFTINTHYQKVENKKNLFHNNIATVGKLFSNISYKLVKNKKEDKFGELLLNGHQMTQGYINSIVKPFSKINKKIYYKTGDNFFKIKDKFFYHSRLDSYIKILGYRVNLESLENKLLKTLSVNNFLYVKDLKIILVIKRVKKNKMNRVKNFINKNFEWYEKPKEIKIVNELPTLPNGKINRKYYS